MTAHLSAGVHSNTSLTCYTQLIIFDVNSSDAHNSPLYYICFIYVIRL